MSGTWIWSFLTRAFQWNFPFWFYLNKISIKIEIWIIFGEQFPARIGVCRFDVSSKKLDPIFWMNFFSISNHIELFDHNGSENYHLSWILDIFIFGFCAITALSSVINKNMWKIAHWVGRKETLSRYKPIQIGLVWLGLVWFGLARLGLLCSAIYIRLKRISLWSSHWDFFIYKKRLVPLYRITHNTKLKCSPFPRIRLVLSFVLN